MEKTTLEWTNLIFGMFLIVLGTRGWDIGVMEKWKYLTCILIGIIFAVVGFVNKQDKTAQVITNE